MEFTLQLILAFSFPPGHAADFAAASHGCCFLPEPTGAFPSCVAGHSLASARQLS